MVYNSANKFAIVRAQFARVCKLERGQSSHSVPTVDKSTIVAYFLTHGSAVRGVRAQCALALKIQIMKILPFSW